MAAVFVGDMMLSRAVATRMVRHGADYPFLKVADFIRHADIAFANLETPITPGAPVPSGAMVFRADDSAGAALARAGFDIVSLANNHTPNFGEVGLLNTLNNLEKAEVKYAGAGKDIDQATKPVYIEKSGITFAFLAYTDGNIVPSEYEANTNRAGTAFMKKSNMITTVRDIRKNKSADIIIVSMHAGDEYVPEPHTLQKEFARAAIDAGADMVIGHHPHVIQTTEVYKGKYIFYSLGNFIFDQMFSLETRTGLVVQAVFTRDGVKDIMERRVLIEDYAQPQFID